MAQKKRNENVLNNGLIMNKGDMDNHQFPINTKFLLSNQTYHMEDFRVTENITDSGTHFRRIQSRNNDAVMTLSNLQQEYMRGNLQFLDAKGEPIANPNKG